MDSRHMTLFFAMMLVAGVVTAQEAVVPHVFSSGDTISASQMNENFSAIASAALSAEVWNAERTEAVEFTDGLAWTAANQGAVWLAGERRSIVGRVSMDSVGVEMAPAAGTRRITRVVTRRAVFNVPARGAAVIGEPRHGRMHQRDAVFAFMASHAERAVVVTSAAFKPFHIRVKAVRVKIIVIVYVAGKIVQWAVQFKSQC